jgi:hypothetical protein
MTDSALTKAIATLPFDLPEGAFLRSWQDQEFEYYLSNELPPPGLWPSLRQQHPLSGLWPIYVEGTEDEPASLLLDRRAGRRVRPDADDVDAEAVLARQWKDVVVLEPDVPPATVTAWTAYFAPYGATWPGLAAGPACPQPPGEAADSLAGRLINGRDTRLGLVRAKRPADIPVLTGWWGGDSLRPEEVSAVLRSWEDRFGARLVRMGFESLVLSVAAPPTSQATALTLAAEHLAFCGEILTTGFTSLSEHADELVDAAEWFFEWDPLDR